MSAHACMIIGLKYLGAVDGLPPRVSVGDVVNLRREQSLPPGCGAVAAYHDGTKIGYLSLEKQTLWGSMRPSARRRATVVGEILDEDGSLVALDIEIAVPSGRKEPPPTAMEPKGAENPPRRRKTLRTTGLALLLALAVMAGADSIGPETPNSAISRMMPIDLLKVDRPPARNAAELIRYEDRNMGLAQVVKLTPSDQVKHLSMLDDQSPSEPGDIANGSAEQAQAYELSRMVQRAHAHRLAEDSRRRAEQALLLQQAEKQKTRQLAEELQQVREVADRQRIQIAREQQARQEAAHLQVENLKVEADIAQFQQRTEEMALTRHQVAEEERKLLALEALNLEELMRHKNRIAAWSLVKQVAQVRKIDKTKTAVRQAPKEKARAASVVPTEKPNGKRKRANFSRYAQENRELE